MKKIVVPCDFSKPAVNAFRFALDIAEKTYGKVYLIHVIELPVVFDSTVPIDNQLFNDLKVNAEKQFKELTTKYNSEAVEVITEVRFGSMHALITRYVQEQEADVIVMGTHGATGIKEFIIGSNAEKIVRTSSVPVIVIKDAFTKTIENIVFPNLLEIEGQEDLLLKVKALQTFFKAHLHLVWINTPLNFTNDTITRTRLEAFAKRFMLKNYSVHIFNYLDGEEGIIHFADQIGADMIAIGTHGRRGLAHIYKGSIAEDIVNHSKYLIWTSVLVKDETLVSK